MNWADRDYAIGRGVAALRHKSGADFQLFLRGLIEQHLPELLAGATGSTFPNVSRTQLAELEVTIPPLSEQRRIAHILGTLDDKIELNRRMNQTLEEIARAIFKSWFIDFDPVHTKAEGREPVGMDPEAVALFPDSFQDSPLGKIPKGWGIGCLGDIAARHRETIKTEDIEDGSPYVALDDIPRASIMLSSWKDAKGIGSSKSRFCKGDVLFGKLRPYFHKVVVAPTDGICSTDIVVIRAKQEVWSTFVLMLCSSKKFISYNAAVMTGTKMPRTNWRDMSKYEMALPPDDLLPAFQVVASPLVRQIVKSIHESRVLSAARDSLLPHLLSGKLGRLEDDK
jgi:type I restriction enzyme S subunit